MLSGKKVLVGITGAIAAYKTIELIRLLKKNGAEVKVVATENALEFITVTTLQTISNNKVFIHQYEIDEYCPEHISLADEADLFLIAPISANTVGKIANGMCDNLLTSIACAFKKPINIAPCMNTNMWENEFVQNNIKKLKSKGIEVVEPEEGFLACGYNGKGRLADINVIFDKVKDVLADDLSLKGKKILITAGGTKENIDPVRYIGNYSSGKMGLALADNAYKMGAEVTLISTFEAEKPYKVIKVNSANEMFEKVKENFANSGMLIMVAAVSDYRVKNISEQKIKKDNSENLTLELVKNPDILSEMAKNKKSDQIIVGFCAESENLIENAKEKLNKKGCDFIAANDISKTGTGFSSDYNEVFIIDKAYNITKIDRDLKENIAKKILKAVHGKNS